MHCRANVMVNDVISTGLKSRIFGYISKGDRVPEVMITDWNRLNTGLIAREESKQEKWRMGFETVGDFSSKGSIMIVNPLVYVDTNVANCVMRTSGEKSDRSAISRVLIKDANLSAQNLRIDVRNSMVKTSSIQKNKNLSVISVPQGLPFYAYFPINIFKEAGR